MYAPRRAWLIAATYFALVLLVAALAGVLDWTWRTPLASATRLADTAWWGLSALCLATIGVGYGLIWPKGTFTDGRASHPALSLGYGATWGLCQGLWFLVLWSLLARSGLASGLVAVLAYLVIGTWNGLWHRLFWDVYVSPPHNYTEWNARKVLLCHTPNLVLGLTHLALYASPKFFVLMQVAALALSARAMRFPALWDDYRARAGEERSLSR